MAPSPVSPPCKFILGADYARGPSELITVISEQSATIRSSLTAPQPINKCVAACGTCPSNSITLDTDFVIPV